MYVVIRAKRKAQKYGGAERPWALILLYPMALRMVGR
jgi:hypothetical protein